MILLIGGTSCTGKTRLAKMLMQQLGIPCFSIDILMMGVFRSNPDCGFNPNDSDIIVSSRIWPIVREMIKTDIENGNCMIYEGVQIHPELISDFSREYSTSIRACFMSFSESYLRKNYNDIIRHRAVVEARNDYPSLEEMLKAAFRIKNECEKHCCELLEIKSDYIGEAEHFSSLLAEHFRQRE